MTKPSMSLIAISALIIFPIICASTARATIFYNEPFSYSDGGLASPAPGVSNGLWVNHSGTGTFIPVASGKITVSQGAGSREDVHRDLPAPLAAGQSIFAGFDVSVTAAGAFTSTNND